jgi:aminoglycoside phosphotransferase (APT) family kinase protein
VDDLSWATPVLAPATTEWVLQAFIQGAFVADVRGLREGGAPWMLRIASGGRDRFAVLRVGDASVRAHIRTEIAALQAARGCGIAVPTLLAADPERNPPLLLTEAIAGSSAIPSQLPAARLRRLGALAASIHETSPPADPALPRRDRPIEGVDFAALWRESPRNPLAARAEELIAAHRPLGSAEGFVHGDLWQGNVLWNGDEIVAVVDWDSAGRGPAGIDLGCLRLDATFCFGPDAACDVLDGWQHHAGRAATDVAYWDLVAGLSTPPDMGWFPPTFVDQGRPDLTAEVLIDRRDAFLAAAIGALLV